MYFALETLKLATGLVVCAGWQLRKIIFTCFVAFYASLMELFFNTLYLLFFSGGMSG